MKQNILGMLAIALLASSGALAAAPRDELFAAYAAEARKADPAFAGFSAARGDAFHRQSFAGGKPDTPACRGCHGDDTRQTGQTPTGKRIAPMAVSRSPERYGDPEKVEKWFTRNCREVLGRDCSAREKGDWLTYVVGR